jgi:hypothetical protein
VGARLLIRISPKDRDQSVASTVSSGRSGAATGGDHTARLQALPSDARTAHTST